MKNTSIFINTSRYSHRKHALHELVYHLRMRLKIFSTSRIIIIIVKSKSVFVSTQDILMFLLRNYVFIYFTSKQ